MCLKGNYMSISDSIPVLGRITIRIVGLKVLPLNCTGYCLRCPIVARFIYSSRKIALRTPLLIEVGPVRSEREMANAQRFGIGLFDALGYADTMFTQI